MKLVPTTENLMFVALQMFKVPEIKTGSSNFWTKSNLNVLVLPFVVTVLQLEKTGLCFISVVSALLIPLCLFIFYVQNGEAGV